MHTCAMLARAKLTYHKQIFPADSLLALLLLVPASLVLQNPRPPFTQEEAGLGRLRHHVSLSALLESARARELSTSEHARDCARERACERGPREYARG